MKVSINEVEWEHKPSTKSEVLQIAQNFKTIESDTADIFNRLISGQTFCPAIFQENKRKNANFISQQLFALDFDEGHSPEEIIQILTDHNIQTNFMYFSFSHKPTHPKFRIVIILDEIITNKKTRDLIQVGLMNISKYSDPACKDSARMFYGGKSGELFNTEPNKYADIIGVIDSYINVDVSKPTQSKNSKQLENFTKNAPLNNIIKGGGKSKVIRHYDFKNACEVSPVLMSFSKGDELKYHVLFALATNMLHIEGGLKWMKNIMDISPNYEADWYNLILRNVKRYNYAPSDISSFDASLIGKYKNLLKLSKPMQRDIEVIDHAKKITANQQQFLFKQSMKRINHRNALNNEGEEVNRVNILKAATGIGKTEVIIGQQNCIIAVPTHELKDQLLARAKSHGFKVSATPKLPTFRNKFLNQKLKYYYSNNLGEKARKLLRSAASFDGNTAAGEDQTKAQVYLDELESALKCEHTVITTHRRAILSAHSFKNKEHIIFDEDPFKELMPITTVNISTVKTIMTEVDGDLFADSNEETSKARKRLRADLRTILTYLDNLPSGYAISPPPLLLLNPENTFEYLSDRPGGISIIELIKSDHIMKYQDENDSLRFYSISKKELPKNKQITICSATADTMFYSKLVDKDITFSDFGIVENKEKIIQYTGKMFSRNQMKKMEEPLNIEGDKVVLTYKDYKYLFANADNIAHFGNLTGFDHLKGKDIVIVGTPLPNPTVLYLYATAMGIKLSNDPQDMEREYKEVRLNGFRWHQFTYKNDELAELEIRLSLMEIEQAAGRGRTARTSSRVTIMSSIPTQMTDEFKI